MVKALHSVKTLQDTAQELQSICDAIQALAAEMAKAKVKNLEINHEQKRRRALADMLDWVQDGQSKLRHVTRIRS